MNDTEPRGDKPVIRNGSELRDALTEAFLRNANSGDDDANDDLVAELIKWRRQNRGRS